MNTLLQDLRYAVRMFAQRPGFTAAVVLTLGLGIGSTVAIFSVANAVLFRPLPYEDPEELVLVWNRHPATNVSRALISGPDFLDYRNETTSFTGFAGAFALNGTITGEGRAEEIVIGWTTENLFRLLGIRPMLGRDFEPADEVAIDPELFLDPNAELPPGTLMLSYGLWQRRFGGDPGVVGTSLQVDGQESLVVGVLPPGFRIYLPVDAGMPTDIEAWRVIPGNFADVARDTEWLTVVSRLKPDVTLERAQQEMDALATRLREQFQHHANAEMQIVLNSMHRDVVDHARPVLFALLGTVGFVLLIACANVANLLLVRASAREREISVRAALGGGRGRILRQMLTESGVLAVGGAALGLIVAWAGGRLLVALSPDNLPRFENVTIDGTVLLFAAGATAAAALVFGLAPALRALRPNLADSLRERGSDTGGAGGNKLRTTLVVGEVALSLVLLIGAGLMMRSFAKLQQVTPGFEADNVLTFSVPLPLFKYRDPVVRNDFYLRLQERIEGLPGVTGVGATAPLPLAGGDQYAVGSYGLAGSTEEEWSRNKADYRVVLPGYTETMGIRVVAGRALTTADNRPGGLDVGVIDQKLADHLWPGQSAVGRELLFERFNTEIFGMERVPLRVVGVVDHVRTESLVADGREALYYPYRMFPWFPLNLTVGTRAAPLGLVDQIRREVETLDPGVPVANVRLMQEYVDDAMAQTRFALTLIAVFAALALVLASIGLYGVIAYSVRQRTREIGVRIAFGAPETTIVRLIVGHGLVLALGGVAAGLVASLLLTRMASSLLVDISATDPLTFAAVSVGLVGVAVLASYLPARRASRVDPVEALRGE